jgi:hypothetical protein
MCCEMGHVVWSVCGVQSPESRCNLQPSLPVVRVRLAAFSVLIARAAGGGETEATT